MITSSRNGDERLREIACRQLGMTRSFEGVSASAIVPGSAIVEGQGESEAYALPPRTKGFR